MITLKLPQAAERAGCHKETLRRMMQAGEAPGTKIGRKWVVSEKIFLDWLAGCEKPKKPEIPRWRLHWAAERIASFMNGEPSPPPPIHTHREAILRATPAWADLRSIRVFYQRAIELTRTTGTPHGVDHLIPLRGTNICGLHVAENLRVITRSENSRKCNRFDLESAAWP